jgi:hypothetical protein
MIAKENKMKNELTVEEITKIVDKHSKPINGEFTHILMSYGMFKYLQKKLGIDYEPDTGLEDSTVVWVKEHKGKFTLRKYR